MTACAYCGCAMTRSSVPSGRSVPVNHATRQHVLAKRYGGSSEPDNLKPCCWGCNQLLAALEECPGALRCWQELGRVMGFGSGYSAARGAMKRLFWRRGGCTLRNYGSLLRAGGAGPEEECDDA